jgi:UDP-N-acetylmuramoyl-L-alanyl-D-glutamate--2,6-diaminopimelate ligase
MMAALKWDSTKTLGDLIAGCADRCAALPVAGLALDSRKVRAGDVFLAYPGEYGDGRDYIAQAIAAGAVAVIAEAGFASAQFAVPVLQIPNLRAAVSQIAGRFYDDPSAALTVIGVTGTNGKTSCTQLLGQALRLIGQSCGVIGTLGNSLDGSVGSGSLTTPDPIALQRQFAAWRGQRVTHVALEVSSHGLAQARVAGVAFRGAVFTNLTRDHLDFHGDMESYGAAKATLFDFAGLEFAILNNDDAFGAALAKKLQPRLPRVITYGFDATSTVHARSAVYRADGVDAQIATPWGAINARSYLLGDFNLSNLLAVIAVLGQLGIDARDIENLIPQLRPIAGRMECIRANTDIEVVVDYAHTPDALEHALSALRRHCEGQLWCVFGCGGDRDKGKRPLMGAAAERLADRVVLTSDNPRSENPKAIIADIQAGISGAVAVEINREYAIKFAIANAQTGDIILLAGKGHEDYQLIGNEVRAFSDSAVAHAMLTARAQA